MTYTDEQLEAQVKATLEAWTAEGTLPADRLDALVRPVRHRRRIRARRIALVTLAASLLLLLSFPPVRAWAAETAAKLPVISQFIKWMAGYDPMWAWAAKHAAFQEIMAESRDQGYTVQLHQVLADPTQTTLILTIQGKQPLKESPDLQNLVFRLLADGQRIANYYRVLPSVVDGVAVVAVETGPLPTEQAHITLDFIQVFGTQGQWRLEAQVTRKPLSDLTRSIPINKDWQIGAITLQVEQVVISPTQTVVKATGPLNGFDIFGSGSGPVLLADGSPLQGRIAHGLGDGNSPMPYTFAFGPLPPATKTLTMQLDGYLMQTAVRSIVPLESGAVVQAKGGWELRVDSYSHAPNGKTEVILSYPHASRDPWRPYDNWSWVDQAGTEHPIVPTLVCKETDPRCLLQFSVLPQEGSAPVRLQADTAWLKVQGPWQIQLMANPVP